MCIKEEQVANDNNSTIRTFTVEIPMGKAANSRVYFWLPNGKRYYIDGDSDEVYLAENQQRD